MKTCHIIEGGKEGREIDALEQSTIVHGLAVSLAKSLSREEASRLGLLLIQLGTTLDTVVALNELQSGDTASTSQLEGR